MPMENLDQPTEICRKGDKSGFLQNYLCKNHDLPPCPKFLQIPGWNHLNVQALCNCVALVHEAIMKRCDIFHIIWTFEKNNGLASVEVH